MIKHRTFMRLFNKVCSGTGKNKAFDIRKLSILTDEERASMIAYLVRHRMAVGYSIPKALAPEGFDWSSLHVIGYLYETEASNGLVFIHTSEARIK